VDPDSDVSKYFVQTYIMGTSISGLYQSDFKAIQLFVEGTEIKDQESSAYIELSKHFNDDNYNKKLAMNTNISIANEFDGIEIVSDKDFSDQLPAGSSLNGIVKLCGVSPIKYIESDYSELFDWENDMPDDFKKGDWNEYVSFDTVYGHYPVNKLVSAVAAQDMLLLHKSFVFLRFIEMPATIKSHTITVTLKEGDKTLSTTVDVIFE
jgi:hypothetical protein